MQIQEMLNQITGSIAIRHMGLANEIINLAFGLILGAIAVAVAYTEQKKEAYQKQIEAELKAYDQKLDKLKAGAMGLKDDAKAEYNQQIDCA